jgi:flagellar biosynthesis GTPase FlhF
MGCEPSRSSQSSQRQKNRKKAETYRFNGLWEMRPVGIAELESLIQRFQRKRIDPNDPDDKKWTARWLQRFQRELAKKERSLERRHGDKANPRKAFSLLLPTGKV